MGFSVSGTYALLFFGFIFAMGTLHTTTANAVEDVREAQQFQNDHLATIQGTEINVTEISAVDAGTCDVDVTVNNTGDTRLSVEETDVFTDGTYHENVAASSAVDGSPETDLWGPGEQLVVDVGERDTAPERAKVVAAPGVADTMEVSTLSC